MPTFKELTDEVSLTMNGYVGGEADATYLSAPIGTSDISFTVADATALSTGLIEIDAELMCVLVNDTDDFASITGLSESARDVVVLGTVARLLGYQEAHRIQGSSIEASERDEDVPAGAALNASKYVYSLYLQRREEERQELLR